MSPPVKQQSDTGLPAEMPPPKAPTRAARPTDLWIVDSNSDLQLEGLADFANLADFASEDTLPPPQPADFVNLADFASEDTLPPPQPADFVNLADFASEDTLLPRSRRIGKGVVHSILFRTK